MRARTKSVWLICALTLILPTGAAALQVRDSAGVKIVTLASILKAPVVFELGTKARVDMGGLEETPDNEFNQTNGYVRALMLAGGGFAVIDGVRVHFFDQAGKRLKIAGRSGRGPEEFASITGACATRGDTLVVTDQSVRRVTVLSGAGAFVRAFLQDTMGAPGNGGCFGEGTMLMQRSSGGGLGMPRTIRLLRVRLDGSVANPLPDLLAPGLELVTQFTPSIAATGDRVHIADGIAGEIRTFSTSGQLLQITRTADARVTIGDEEAETQFRRTIPRNTPEADVSRRMDQFRTTPHAKTWPVFRTILSGTDGIHWLQDDFPKTYPAPLGWTAVDLAGRVLGRLIIPAPKEGERAPEVLGFGKGEVLVRRRDGDGALHFTVYPLVRK